MKRKIFSIFFILFYFFSWGQLGLSHRKRVDHEKIAIAEKHDSIVSILKKNNIKLKDLEVLFIIYKEENQLVVYAKNWFDLQFKPIISYEICFQSGQLGPKRCQGDYQIPEGFYHIIYFNRYSDYFLSLGINYPNLSDKRKSRGCRLGGNITIHGGCNSTGCIPMTDEIVKYIYLFALYSSPTDRRAKVHVYIFPFKMTNENLQKHAELYKNNDELLLFWLNLMTGYEKFMQTKKDLKYDINKKGDYIFR